MMTSDEIWENYQSAKNEMLDRFSQETEKTYKFYEDWETDPHIDVNLGVLRNEFRRRTGKMPSLVLSETGMCKLKRNRHFCDEIAGKFFIRPEFMNKQEFADAIAEIVRMKVLPHDCEQFPGGIAEEHFQRGGIIWTFPGIKDCALWSLRDTYHDD